MALNKLPEDGSTPIRDFPAIYNEMIQTLQEKLAEKDEQITNLTNVIANLKSAFNSAIGRIRAEYIQMFDNINIHSTYLLDNEGYLLYDNNGVKTRVPAKNKGYAKSYEEIDPSFTGTLITVSDEIKNIEDRVTAVEENLNSSE